MTLDQGPIPAGVRQSYSFPDVLLFGDCHDNVNRPVDGNVKSAGLPFRSSLSRVVRTRRDARLPAAMTYRLTRLCARKQEIQLEGEEMKPLLLLVVTIAVSACASQPMPPSAQSLGESQQPVPAVSQCIAQKWANQSQQTVISQVIVANNQAMDVYVPGQQPPNGAAALVRPSWTGNSKTWVGFRAGSGTGGNTGGDVSGCL